MIKQEIYAFISQALEQLKKEKFIPENIKLPEYTIEIPPSHIPADLASNVVLLLSQKMNKPAQKIAEKIIPLFALRSEFIPPEAGLIAKVEFSPPGFLNFWIAPGRLHQELKKITQEKDSYGKIDLGKNKKILFEFVSANPTGPLHVGHGRGAAIGDSLARTFEFFGWKAEREYYLNDVGNQIDNLGATVMSKCEELAKGYLVPEEKEWLDKRNREEFYQGEYITRIAQEIIKEYPNSDLHQTGHNFFAQQAIKKIMNWIKEDLETFDVKFDNWIYESSFYSPRFGEAGQTQAVEEVIKILKDKGFIYEKDNAHWFKSTFLDDEKDRVVRRKDERYTYFGSDLAYHRDKFKRGFDRLINLWGADHHGYIPRVKAGVKALGYDLENLQIVLYQLVTLSRAGKPVPMSTRAGEFITLRDLINEVGKDACRFFFISRSPQAQLEFDLELAKKQSPENPVYYIQYAYTRVAGIFREAIKAGIRDEGRGTNEDLKLLKEKEELNLIKKLSFFSDTLVTCIEDLSPHYLTTYLLDLANNFHGYYEKYRVISEDKDLTLARLSLAQAIGIIIKNGLNLIGVSAPEKM